jgi:hypothetical protein
MRGIAMRRIRWLLIAITCFAAVAGGAVVFHYEFVDTAYSQTEFYADTGIVALPREPGVIAESEYVERSGRIILCLSRGEPHGIITTSHGWDEHLSIEIPWPSKDEQIELDRSDVRLAFSAFDGRRFAEIGDGGVHGHVQIESADKRRIVATYVVTVDACFRSPYQPCSRHKDVVFRGQSTFRLRPRPEGMRLGDLWPRPVQPNPPRN